MESLAITDHGVMYGAIEFYKQCRDAGINPILGFEAYVAKEDHTIKDANKKTNANHLLLLAKDYEGYRNLMELSSIGFLEGFYYKPRFDKETLKKHSKGLICTSACAAGIVAEHLIADDYEGAKKQVEWYADVFGEDYYLELQRHQYELFLPGITEQKIRDDIARMAEYEKKINEGKIRLSKEMGIDLIVTNDSHYIEQEDAVAQDALVCVATGNTVDEVDRLRFVDVPGYYFSSPDQMKELFPDQLEAVANTKKVAQKCDLKITLGEWYFPKPSLPEGKNEVEYLRELVDEHKEERMNLSEATPEIQEEIAARLEFELDTICSKGYAGYFLIYRDFAKWTRENNIITNTRGSAAGSLVSFILGVTTVDPIKYYLPFERFLNPYRPSPPDIDLDIADDKRIAMIEFITQKFGKENVAQICTFGRMMARAAAKDIARALGYDYSFGDQLSKMIPEGSQGFPMSLERALEESPDLKARYDSEPDVKRVIDLGRKVERNARHISVHAAAVVAAPEKITHYSPLQYETKGDKVITQYEMHAAEDVGLIKFDILGITQLSIMNNALDIIERHHGIRIDLENISLEDEKTYELLARGETLGVFQLGGSGMTKWLMELKPRKVEDIMAMIALFRPGPMANIPEYIARHHGQKKIEYSHPKMSKFLDKSYGILVYQDDLLFTALELAGYNWEEVDKFRKAVGKKIPEEMAKQHIKFVAGCQEHSGMSEAEAEKLWELFEPFQGYGFNKAHAASYGMVSYRSAYLKANYPVEFMAALLTADAGTTDKVTADMADAKRMGIVVLPPDINESMERFTLSALEESLEGQAIRFGLSAVKNVGGAALENILHEREENGKFNNLTDFLMRVDGRKVNKKVLESLIKVGAMEAFGNRAQLLQVIDDVKAQIDRAMKNKVAGQGGLFDGDETMEVGQMVLPEVDDLGVEQKLAYERELLGFYISDNPMEKRLAVIAGAVSEKIGDLSAGRHYGKKMKLGGYITQVRTVVTKKSGKPMAFATIEDDTGTIDAVIFPKVYANTKDVWQQDQMVIVEGKLDFRDESLNILVDEVSIVVNGENPISMDDEHHTLLVPRGTRQGQLVKINSLLKNYPGEEKLVLLFENGGTKPKPMKVPFGITFSENLRQEIAEVLRSPF